MGRIRKSGLVTSAALALLPALWLAAAAPVRVDLSKEKAGAEPKAFLPVVGNWLIVEEEGKKVVLVDGRQWRKGQPAGGLAENARTIYGSRHEEFIDNVKAFAYFPYAVATGIGDFQDGEISMRFRLLEGLLDQCAGILFNLKPNGDYWTVRFNDKEDNLVLWKFESGKRSFVKKGVHDVAIPMKTWHSMRIVTKGPRVTASLDGEVLLEYDLPAPISGKVGLWSKTDSVSEFSDYVVTAAPAAR
ncbi:MAG TPA: family 16 glycoside hydrolase [Thermoanaerobaculia bacterium]|nr:family 16 glycoside hydrolase [Thermoanaerobaculia bacterium]